MAAIDRRLSKARTDVCEWNVDRDWGFRGTKGYGISRNYYHRTARRFSKKLCKVVPVVDIAVQRLWGETVYVHNVSDPKTW